MTIDDRIKKLDEIVAHLRDRRAEVEDQLARHDIPASKLVDFRIQITAQLSVLDGTIRNLKRRQRDLKEVQELKSKIKELTSGQIGTMRAALDAVQISIKATAAVKDVIKVAQAAAKAATKAGEAAAPTRV